MEPIFTLSYTEYCIANYLADHFKRKDGFSVHAPLSRQEKGIDLILTKRRGTTCASVSIQVKASRTYPSKPPKRKTTKRYTFNTWFNRFEVPEEADFFTLVGIYPPQENRTKKNMRSWWSPIILMLTQSEMKDFMDSVKTKKGKEDKMFGFGFDEPSFIYHTRGNQDFNIKDVSHFLIEHRIAMLSTLLEERLKKLKP